jgi:hypothetical protein
VPGQINLFREPTKHPAKVTIPDLKLAGLVPAPAQDRSIIAVLIG